MIRANVVAFVVAATAGLGMGIPATAGAAVNDRAQPPVQQAESVCPGKQAWPELVGTHVHKAQRTIERENPNVTAIAVPEGSPVTLDFRCDRVWVFHTEDGPRPLVAETPRVG